jgi:hypothetical protein
MRRIHLYAAVAALAAGLVSAAKAEGLHAVGPLAGYACMNLKLTDKELQDKSLAVPVYDGPSKESSRVGNAAAVVIAKSPLHVVNGFAELLFPTGQEVWIEADLLTPYRSASDPNAHCTPSLMSNGKPGFGP